MAIIKWIMDHSFSLWAIIEGPCPTLSRGPKGGPRDNVFRVVMANVVGLYPTNVGSEDGGNHSADRKGPGTGA